MAVLALGAHQRGDLLFPVVPAAALLAGGEVADWWGRRPPKVALAGAVVVPLVGLALLGVHRHVLRPREPEVRQTLAVQQLARELLAITGKECPLTDVDAPYGLQVFLNTRHEPVTPEQAARLLAGEALVRVAVMDTNAVNAALPEGTRVHLLGRAELPERGALHILTNHPDSSSATNRPVALGLGPLAVSYDGADARHLTAERLDFAATDRPGWIRVRNDGELSRAVRLRLRDSEQPGRVWRHALEPGEVWRVSTPAVRGSSEQP